MQKIIMNFNISIDIPKFINHLLLYTILLK